MGISGSILHVKRRRAALDGLIPQAVDPAASVGTSECRVGVINSRVNESDEDAASSQIKGRLVLNRSDSRNLQADCIQERVEIRYRIIEESVS